MKAYKLFRVRKDSSLGPLFINATLRIPMNEWMDAEPHRKKGFAFRPGWHACFQPIAPHLKEDGVVKRVWTECEIEDHITYSRPESQGGAWVLAKKLRVIRTLTKTEVKEIRDGTTQ